jgi:hypothetical protein
MRGPSLNDDRLHPVLAELPVFAPGADLWSRIAATHASTQAVRRDARPRWYRWAGIAAAAAAIVVTALVTGPRMRTQPALVEGQRESQTLEREWQTLTPASARPASSLARLHMIDAALQAAYDRGAQPDELQPLWKQRNEALRGLILIARTDEVTRI